MLGQGLLHLDGGCHSGAGRREDREERVALGPLLDALVGLEAGADEPVVVVEDLGVDDIAEAPQEHRRSLNVREQEGQRLDAESVGDELQGCRLDQYTCLTPGRATSVPARPCPRVLVGGSSSTDCRTECRPASTKWAHRSTVNSRQSRPARPEALHAARLRELGRCWPRSLVVGWSSLLDRVRMTPFTAFDQPGLVPVGYAPRATRVPHRVARRAN